MESLVSSSFVQAVDLFPESWTGICSYWQWAFWVGFFVGVVGSIVCLFLRPIQSS
jgi:hypothetical protein